MRKFCIISLIVIFVTGFMPVDFTVEAHAQISEINEQKRIEMIESFKQQIGDLNLSKQERNITDQIKQKARVKTLKNIFEKDVNFKKGPREFNAKNFNFEQLKKKFKKTKKSNYVPGEILIKFKKQNINLEIFVGRMKAEQFAVGKNLDKKEDIKKSNISVLKIKKDESVEAVVERLKNDPNVEYVQPNFIYYPREINTNDTHRDYLWGLDNAGQEVNTVSGTQDADIDAPEAWEISEGNEDEVIVAIIDDGVAYNHPDLAANMWNGNGCTGIDSIGNPISGGCNHGYDFEDNDKTPLPTIGSHGTHIAGIIAAVKNNSKGIIGVAPQAKIMAIKSSLTTSNVVKSIDFAQQNGAKVINASWGSYGIPSEHYDSALYNAINGFPGLFVVAAGNAGYNHDDGITTHKSYPDGFKITTPIGPGLNNIIVVAATNQDDDLTSWSDYGINSVDVGAPGENIFSTISTYYYDNLLLEELEGVSPPNIPSGWQSDGYWGTYNIGGLSGNVMYGDYLNYPYANNVNSALTLPSYSLNDVRYATMDFITYCDTEYSTSSWYDYMALEMSSDGSNYSELIKWDEATLDILNGDPPDSTGGSVYLFSFIIPSDYYTSTFKPRFRWFTDLSVGADGCFIDFLVITKYFYSDGSEENYDFNDGTSMAAPHVAGLATLILGYEPELTYLEIKDIILTTGDDLSSLVGKTVTGKRINAFNALQSLSPEGLTLSGTVTYYDGVKPILDANVILEDDQGTQLFATTTDANGYYEFNDLNSGDNYVVRIEKNDYDPINGINGLDLTTIVRHIANIEILDSIYKFISADVNEDNNIVGLDLTNIVRYIVGLDSVLPSGGWKFYDSEAILTEQNYLTVGLTRIYNNLITNMANQDFTGVKMGDVNNSWTNN